MSARDLHEADAALDVTGKAGVFAAGPCTQLEALITQAAKDTRPADMSDIRSLLVSLRGALAGLDPSALVPQGGLAGLLDSRRHRLQKFRAAWRTAAATTLEVASDLGQHAGVVTRCREASDALWDQLRAAVAVLDAQIVAGQAWLAQRAQRARAGDEDTSAGGARPETEPGLLYTLEDRLAALDLRRRALEHLPALRAARNAEHRLPATLLGLREAVLAWQADWQDALGLAGPRPRRVQPDPDRLNASRTAVLHAVELAEGQLRATGQRMSELEARVVRQSGKNGTASQA